MSTLTTVGFPELGGIWTTTTNEEVGRLTYTSGGSTFSAPIEFDVSMDGKMCTNPILTIDLRSACGDDSQVVFDVIPVVQLTPGSENGRIDISGGGCGTVPVFADYGVGIDGAAPVGDLFLVLTMDFGAAGCTFSDDLIIILDSDTTVPRPGLCDMGMNGDPHVKVRMQSKHDLNRPGVTLS